MKHYLDGDSLLDFIEDRDKLLPGGDLTHYYRCIWNMPNVNHGYHGLAHTTTVTWKCAQAGIWYMDRDECGPLEIRKLLIAALFHDYNHTNRVGSDELEIERALKGLRENILPSDMQHIGEIESLIKATQFPHQNVDGRPELQLAIMDADITQGIQQTWQQMICFGLGEELNKSPIQMVREQEGFLTNVMKIRSKWGKTVWTPGVILERVAHHRQLLRILED